MAAEEIIVDAGNAGDLMLAQQIAEALEAHYPGYLWMVHADQKQGIATVKAGSLSGEWGFVLHTSDFYSASETKRRAIMAGGEVLERYKQPRRRANWDAIAALPTDFSGRHKPDL